VETRHFPEVFILLGLYVALPESAVDKGFKNVNLLQISAFSWRRIDSIGLAK
jgi:hypothetical protein